MKKIILSLSALCMVAFTSCKEDATSKIKAENVTQAAQRDAVVGEFPVITFDRKEHDFGEIDNGTPVSTVFNYTNSGNSPLVITNITSTCGCTVPQDWSKEPLAPGASAKFTVDFNGKGSPGSSTSKTVTITANTESGKETVKIKAFIKGTPGTATGIPGVATTQVKSSTQPGHEGHNHD